MTGVSSVTFCYHKFKFFTLNLPQIQISYPIIATIQLQIVTKMVSAIPKILSPHYFQCMPSVTIWYRTVTIILHQIQIYHLKFTPNFNSLPNHRYHSATNRHRNATILSLHYFQCIFEAGRKSYLILTHVKLVPFFRLRFPPILLTQWDEFWFVDRGRSNKCLHGKERKSSFELSGIKCKPVLFRI